MTDNAKRARALLDKLAWATMESESEGMSPNLIAKMRRETVEADFDTVEREALERAAAVPERQAEQLEAYHARGMVEVQRLRIALKNCAKAIRALIGAERV